MSRRTFLKGSAIAGGSLLFSGLFSMQESEMIDNVNKYCHEDEILTDVCDIHLHATPDSRERSVDEWNFSREARQAGYRAVMFKSNDFSCHDRAYLIRQGLPDMQVFGSLCMNRVHGERVNAFAAEKLSRPPEVYVVAFGCQPLMPPIIIAARDEKNKAFPSWMIWVEYCRK